MDFMACLSSRGSTGAVAGNMTQGGRGMNRCVTRRHGAETTQCCPCTPVPQHPETDTRVLPPGHVPLRNSLRVVPYRHSTWKMCRTARGIRDGRDILQCELLRLARWPRYVPQRTGRSSGIICSVTRLLRRRQNVILSLPAVEKDRAGTDHGGLCGGTAETGPRRGGP